MLTVNLKVRARNPNAWETEGELDFKVACKYTVSSGSYNKRVGPHSGS